MDLGLLPFAPLLGILRHMVIKGIKGTTCGYTLWIECYKPVMDD